MKLEERARKLDKAEKLLAKARVDILDALYLTTTAARTALDYLERAHDALIRAATDAENAVSKRRL